MISGSLISKTYRMKRLLKSLVKPTSIFLGITFFGAGMAKLYFEHKYFGWIGPVWLEERLEPHGLGLYARFIAVSQVIIGYMMLTLRFRTLGAIMMVPLVLNILMVTISQEWRGTPFVLAVLLMMVIYLLLMDIYRLLPLIGVRPVNTHYPEYRSKANFIWLVGLVLNILSIPLSEGNLYMAWGVSILGVLISFLAYRWDVTDS